MGGGFRIQFVQSHSPKRPALERPEALDAETAKALAQHKGGLSLNGLTTLSGKAAKALAESKVWDGRLPKLTALNGLTTLDAITAKALAAIDNWDGNLPNLTALDSPDSVAQALATLKDWLSLPNLKKISPKTLTALIEKEDVEFPLIKTLQLIAEPDGSGPSDFVIPEGFRQMRRGPPASPF